MIETNIEKLRDPFVLIENGVYYMYGSLWHCYTNESGRLDGEWVDRGVVVTVPKEAKDCFWAPEVHKYKGAFYMFTTYLSSETNHRGCTILKSENPLGPFVEITDGQITPKDRDAIDGTFYIDEDGQPWMVFVHEWTSTDDGVGRMAAAKLSDDLTHFVSEPIELFRADEPSWTDYKVTDGCFMYKTESGRLLMIWSNFDKNMGYCLGIAHSDNGKIDGKWIQEDKLLFQKGMFSEYDGGHGMIFTDLDSQKYISLHSPNAAVGNRKEKPIFMPVREANGTLECVK